MNLVQSYSKALETTSEDMQVGKLFKIIGFRSSWCVECGYKIGDIMRVAANHGEKRSRTSCYYCPYTECFTVITMDKLYGSIACSFILQKQREEDLND